MKMNRLWNSAALAFCLALTWTLTEPVTAEASAPEPPDFQIAERIFLPLLDFPVPQLLAVSKPVITASGFIGGKTVKITAASGDIYYTLDGAAPTEDSFRYEEPFPLTDSHTVRAIAVADGEKSAVARSQVSVTQVAPVIARPTPEEFLSRLGAEGVVTLETETKNAVIRYTTDGSEPTLNSAKYDGAITLYQDTTIKAIAALSGYRTSEIMEAAYTVNVREENKAQVTLGYAEEGMSGEPLTDGDEVSIPVSIDTGERNRLNDSLSEVTEIVSAHIELTYDPATLIYKGCTPDMDGVTQSALADSESGGRIRVDLKDLEAPIEGGQVFTLQFSVSRSAEKGVSRLFLDPQTTWVNGTSQVSQNETQPLTLELYDGNTDGYGYVFLSDTTNSRVQRVTFADGAENPLSDVSRIQADTTIHGEMNVSKNVPPSQLRPEQFITASVFCVVYDADGRMVSLQQWEADVSDPRNIRTSGEAEIPPGVTVSRIKVIVLSDELTPVCMSGMF